MVSPVSVGDCIAILNIVVTGCNGLSGSSEDAKWLNDLHEDLLGLRDVLGQLEASARDPSSLPDEPRKKLVLSVKHCQGAISDLSHSMSKYHSESLASRYWKRLRFSLGGKQDLEPHQRRLHGCLTSLLVLQQEINWLAIVDVKNEVRGSTQQLVSSYQQGTEEIKLEIYRGIDEPWDQKPIRFQDASGRRYPVPLEICANFTDFMDFLKFSFKADAAIASLISRKSFWLFTPPRNGGTWWYLINEDDWETAARPGVKLGMSLYQKKRCEGPCPDLRHVIEPSTQASVRLSIPTPAWNTLPDSLEFRWISKPARSGPLSMSTSGEASSLGLISPNIERKHIRFDHNVLQCIAVEVKGDEDDDAADTDRYGYTSDSDNGAMQMKRTSLKKKKKQPLLKNW